MGAAHNIHLRICLTLASFCKGKLAVMSRVPLILLWVGISALGAVAVAVSALYHGEQINALWLVVQASTPSR